MSSSTYFTSFYINIQNHASFLNKLFMLKALNFCQHRFRSVISNSKVVLLWTLFFFFFHTDLAKADPAEAKLYKKCRNHRRRTRAGLNSSVCITDLAKANLNHNFTETMRPGHLFRAQGKLPKVLPWTVANSSWKSHEPITICVSERPTKLQWISSLMT